MFKLLIEAWIPLCEAVLRLMLSITKLAPRLRKKLLKAFMHPDFLTPARRPETGLRPKLETRI